MTETHLPIPKTSLEKLLRPINRLTESCVLRVESNTIYSLCTSSDNSVILYAKCAIPAEVNSHKLNLINIKKLLTGLDCLGDDGQFSMRLLKNSIICQSKNDENGENTHFKYHLASDGIIKESPVKLENISSLTFDTEFDIPLSKIRQIMSAYSFVSDATKIYFHTKDGKVYADIDDKSDNRSNIDNISLLVSNTFEGKQISPISIKIEVFKSLISSKQPVNVKINNTKKVFVFNSKEDDNVDLKFIVSALVK